MAMFQSETGPAMTGSARVRRWRMFAGVWLLLLIEPLRDVLHQPTLVERVAGIALLVVFCVLYIFLVPQALERNAYRSGLPLALSLITPHLQGWWTGCIRPLHPGYRRRAANHRAHACRDSADTRSS
jgi:hypothetical protein